MASSKNDLNSTASRHDKVLDKATMPKDNVDTLIKTCPEHSGQTQHIPETIQKQWQLPLWSLEGISTSSLLRRAEVLRTLFVCVCLCHICPVSSCGVDPMRYVENYARLKGFDSSSRILDYMKMNTPSDYDRLMNDKKDFIACTRMVHTGYFKRSGAAPANTQQLFPDPFLSGSQTFAKPNGNTLSQILANRGTFDMGPLLQAGLDSFWADYQRQGQLEAQDAMSAYENEAFPSFLQRLKDYGQQTSPELLSGANSFAVPEYYNQLNRKRR